MPHWIFKKIVSVSVMRIKVFFLDWPYFSMSNVSTVKILDRITGECELDVLLIECIKFFSFRPSKPSA